MRAELLSAQGMSIVLSLESTNLVLIPISCAAGSTAGSLNVMLHINHEDGHNPKERGMFQ
jgi:hypothetical protein